MTNQLQCRNDLSVMILAKISPSGSAIMISSADASQDAEGLRDNSPRLYTARYRYIPGTIITMDGTVTDIRGYPSRR